MTHSPSQANAPLPADKAQKWVNEVSGLVSPPDVCITVFELVESNTATARALGEVISRDPSLTARLLKLVNSAFYHFSKRIDTVSRAVTVIGISELYSLVIAVSAIKSFSKIPNYLINIDTFWRHSLYCGLIARIIARRCNVLHPERLFVAGLLHDIGSLVLFDRAPQEARDLLLAAQGDEDVLYLSEIKEFGFSHADLGGLLLGDWNLPLALRDAVQNHHRPEAADAGKMEAAIVHIANALANRSDLGGFFEIPPQDVYIDEAAWAEVRLDPAEVDLDQLIAEAGLQFADSVNVFCG